MKKSVFFIALLLVIICKLHAQKYSFYKHAAGARWESSTIDHNSNALPGTTNRLTFGKSHGENGVAIINKSILENGKIYTILHTHPKWTSNGTIKGWFPPIIKLPKNSKFLAQIGFIKPQGTPGTDGARFMVYLHYYVNGVERWKPIVNIYKKYTGKLHPISYDLAAYAGQKVYFELRVDAGKSSGQDWAAWVNPRVMQKNNNTEVFKPENFGERCFTTAEGHLKGTNRNIGTESDGRVNMKFELVNNSIKVIVTAKIWRDFVSATWSKILFEGVDKEIEGFDIIYRPSIKPNFQNVHTQNIVFRLPKGGADFFDCDKGTIKEVKTNYGLIKMIGDTGGTDITTNYDCSCDAKLVDIIFNQMIVKYKDN